MGRPLFSFVRLQFLHVSLYLRLPYISANIECCSRRPHRLSNSQQDTAFTTTRDAVGITKWNRFSNLLLRNAGKSAQPTPAAPSSLWSLVRFAAAFFLMRNHRALPLEASSPDTKVRLSFGPVFKAFCDCRWPFFPFPFVARDTLLRLFVCGLKAEELADTKVVATFSPSAGTAAVFSVSPPLCSAMGPDCIIVTRRWSRHGAQFFRFSALCSNTPPLYVSTSRQTPDVPRPPSSRLPTWPVPLAPSSPKSCRPAMAHLLATVGTLVMAHVPAPQPRVLSRTFALGKHPVTSAQAVPSWATPVLVLPRGFKCTSSAKVRA